MDLNIRTEGCNLIKWLTGAALEMRNGLFVPDVGLNCKKAGKYNGI